MTPQPLPTEFILKNVTLTWREMLWGYEHQWADWSCLNELATLRVGLDCESKPVEVELAGMLKCESAGAIELVRKLVDDERPLPEDVLEKKWLYLVLRWLFENRHLVPDVFAIVEELFSDFDYPQEMATFVGFMPPTDGYEPSKHSKAENVDRMFNNWQKYLINAEKQFRNTSG